MCDGDADCKANTFVFIITIAALAHILHAKCSPYPNELPVKVNFMMFLSLTIKFRIKPLILEIVNYRRGCPIQ